MQIIYKAVFAGQKWSRILRLVIFPVAKRCSEIRNFISCWVDYKVAIRSIDPHHFFYSLSARQSQCFCNSRKTAWSYQSNCRLTCGHSETNGFCVSVFLSITTKRFRLLWCTVLVSFIFKIVDICFCWILGVRRKRDLI